MKDAIPLDGEFARFAARLALTAGEKIRGHYQKDLVISRKADLTIVTQADREAETLMRDLIRREYPAHGILGEEFGRENEGAEFTWVLDPIDGTISFAHGCPLFATCPSVPSPTRNSLCAHRCATLGPRCSTRRSRSPSSWRKKTSPTSILR